MYDFDSLRLERVMAGRGVPGTVTGKVRGRMFTYYTLRLHLPRYIGEFTQSRIEIFMGAARSVDVWQRGTEAEIRIG